MKVFGRSLSPFHRAFWAGALHKKWLAIALAALPFATLAQSPERPPVGLGDLGALLSPLVAPELEPESDFADTAEGLNAALGQATIIINELERKSDLGESLAEELELLEVQAFALRESAAAVEAMLFELETHLRTHGLESKLPALNEFRNHTQARLAAANSQIRAVVNSKGARGDLLRGASEQLTQLIRTAAPSRSEQWSSGTQAEPVMEPAPNPLPLGEVKPDRDGARTAAVNEITPEIQALADRLGRNPARIFAFVYNNIEYAHYRGYMQNAQSVLNSRKGNEWDQSSLLIALLRASGFQAGYVDGHIRLTTAQWMNWLEVKTVEAAENITRFKSFVEIEGNQVRIDHAWVEVVINGQARWLDPTVKVHAFEPTIVVPEIPFDKDGFLSEVRPELGTEWYLNQLNDYLMANHPGAELTDLPYQGRIVPASDKQLPARLPYQVVFTRTRMTDVLADYHHRFVITMIDPNDGTTDIGNYEFNMGEAVLDQFAVTFRPATQSDAETIDSFGGVYNTPAFLANVIPEVRRNGELVIEASKAVPLGVAVSIHTDVFQPFAQEPVEMQQPVVAGELAVIGLEGIANNDRFLKTLLEQAVDGATPIDQRDPDQLVLDTLQIGLVRYNQRVREERERVSEALQYNSIEIRSATIFLRAAQQRDTLLDRPFLVTHRSMTIGALGTIGIGFNRDRGNGFPEERLRNLHDVVAMAGVGLEHEIFEEIFLRPGISAVRGVQLANQNGIPLVYFTPEQAPAAIAGLDYPAFGKQLMQRWANDGFDVETPITPIDYEGSRWITFFAWADFGGFVGELQRIQSDGSGAPVVKGGGSGTNPPEEQEEGPGGEGSGEQQGATDCPQPVSLSNGNMYHQFDDVFLRERGITILLRRTYNSQSEREGPFGYGWSHNFEISLRVEGDTAFYTNDSGGVETLNRQGTQFVSDAIRGLRLSTDGDGHVLRERSGTQQFFNAQGKLTQIRNLNGNFLDFIYDGQGRLEMVSGPLNRGITFSYDGQNRITQIVDYTGRTWNYTYDGRGDLVQSNNPSNNPVTYTYFTSSFNDHNLKTITDPEGNTVSFVYYADDRIFQTTGGGNDTRSYFYLRARNETQAVDERGNRTRYFFDDAGRVNRTIDPDGTVTDRRYNADGLVESLIEGGYETQYEYDSLGNITRVTDPLGNVRQYSYDAFSKLRNSTDAHGNVTSLEYDSRGNVIREIDPMGNVFEASYGDFGQLTSYTDPTGVTTQLRYDEQGRQVEREVGSGQISRYEYDQLDRVTRMINAAGQASTLEYDVRGLLTKTIDAAGGETSYVYDRVGRLLRITDPNGHTTDFGYNGRSLVDEVTDALGNRTTYSYSTVDCFCNATAELHQATNANGATTNFGFDFRSLQNEEVDPLGGMRNIVYDSRGNEETVNLPTGGTIQHDYDAAGRVISRTYPDGSSDRFAYDAAGNLTRAENDLVTYTYEYDAAGRRTAIHDSRFNATIRYEYDGAGRRTRLIGPQGGVTAYTYDGNGNLASISSPSGLTTEFTTNALGQRTEARFANGTRAAYTYDVNERLSSVRYLGSGEQMLSMLDIAYDAAGNQISGTDLDGQHTYGYDAADQLVSAQHPNMPAESYSYDAVGNRVGTAGVSGIAYNVADQVVSFGGIRFDYDRAGNRSARRAGQGSHSGAARRAVGTTRYEHDALNRLIAAEHPSMSAAYGYDPMGRRILKVVNGEVTQYVYDGLATLEERDGQGNVIARYTYSRRVDEPLIMERDLNGDRSFQQNEQFFYQSGRLRTVTALTDSTGNVVERYTYDSFGNVTVSGPDPVRSTFGNPFLYTGREWDPETGLYNYRARYYDPETGRFLEREPESSLPLPTSLNAYTYVSNNPLNLSDPLGRDGTGEFGSGLSQFQTQFIQGALTTNYEQGNLTLDGGFGAVTINEDQFDDLNEDYLHYLETGEDVQGQGFLGYLENNIGLNETSNIILQDIDRRIAELEAEREFAPVSYGDFTGDEQIRQLRFLKARILENCN